MPLPIDTLQIQLGKETTWGTVVAGTVKLMDATKCSLAPKIDSVIHKHLRGTYQPAYNAAVVKASGEAKVETDLSYEDAPYWLEHIFDIATPTGTSPYVRTYAAPIGTASVPRFSSLIYGDTGSTNVYTLAGAIGTKILIKGDRAGLLTASVDLIGKKVSTGTLASLSDRTTTLALGAQTKLYIDAWGGTAGTTEMLNVGYTFELTLTPPRAPRFALGSVEPIGWTDEHAWDVKANTLKMSLELGTLSKAFLDAALGETLFQKQVRVKATTGASQILQFDFAGTATTVPQVFTDANGIATLDFTLEAEYNTALANWFAASITNSVAALA